MSTPVWAPIIEVLRSTTLVPSRTAGFSTASTPTRHAPAGRAGDHTVTVVARESWEMMPHTATGNHCAPLPRKARNSALQTDGLCRHDGALPAFFD
jgi:hypothetical protein